MKKQKTTLALMLATRRSWYINPVTRVHDQQKKKDIKKIRNENKKSCRSYFKQDLQDFSLIAL